MFLWIFFWGGGNFFNLLSKIKKSLLCSSSKSYRGSKTISEGVGVILSLTKGVIIFFSDGVGV